jgi:hypothetical protein
MEKFRHAFALGEGPAPEDKPLPAVLSRLAVQIVDRKMETPAIVLADSLAPISFVTGQMMQSVWPLIKMAGRFDDYLAVAEALEDRRMIERFVTELERLAREKRARGDHS